MSDLRLKGSIIGPCLALGISSFVMLSTESILSISFTSSLSKFGGDMAVGAMTYLKEIGLRIPDDVQIAGIGDGVPGKIVEPKLTTVHFYYKTSGMEAAAMLADLIENDTGISKEIKMGCELVERESHR